MRHSHSVRRIRLALTFTLVVLGATGILAPSALASEPAPGWEVFPGLYPSNVAPGGSAYLVIPVYNVGGAASSSAVTVTDKLPPGFTAVEAGYYAYNPLVEQEGLLWKCTLGAVVSCVNDPVRLPSIPPGGEYFLDIVVKAPNVTGSALNEVTVSGGGALTPAVATNSIPVSSTPGSFGFQRMDAWFSSADGALDTQAGSHPYSLTVPFFLNNEGERPVGEARNIVVNAPPGLVGNPSAVPRCARGELEANRCPTDTQIGVDIVTLGGPEGQTKGTPERSIEEEGGFVFALPFPVFNMVPPPGVPAQFGFSLAGNGTRLDAAVRSGSDYGISEHINNITQKSITFNSLTIWGVPSESSHDFQRCGRGSEEVLTRCGKPANIAKVPFLTLPTSCVGPQTFSAITEPWTGAGGLNAGVSEVSFLTHGDAGIPEGLTGCDHLGFAPSMDLAPDTSSADTPAGLSVDVKVPQEGLLNPQGLAISNIKNTTVTLPEGFAINPGQAAGLAACQASQSAVGTEGEPSCPNASKVGTDEISTPLLAHKLEGNVYVLQSDPPNLKLLVTASGEGVNLKLVGDVHLDETTGQLTSTFTETPELPFTDFKLSFSGGAQAALSTPTRCGTYTTTSDFTPWSTPFVQDAFPSSTFQVSSGPGGSACAWPLPFAPSMIAGSTTDQAGGFTNFSLLLTRPDDQQRVSTLQFKTPEGLLGMISKVPLCPEPQASQGTCSNESQIGHTVVEAGPGPYPLVVPQPGQPPAPIYLTGGYEGAPYGLSIVVPLKVGPFTLQTQVVRSRIEVNPLTTELTVTTDPLPQVIGGVPSDLRAINAVIDRPGFMFNPTSCAPMSFSGTATSNEGAKAAIASHFQVGSCRSLTFKPNFKVSTSGKTSRKNGASLDAKIVYPTGALGNNQASSQSNVKMVKVDLPKQLPSRLTTLQKACPAATFEANPAGCPANSRVGQATAVTPVLPVGLSGPAYFVSYGGAKFPELVIALQGYGVTVYLHGETFISKAGITSSTFRQVPDVPITSFELKLPQGPFSALAANGNLCASKLKMPTVFTGQNNAVLHQNTPVTVTGCPKHKKIAGKKAKRARKAGRLGRSHGRRG